MTTEQYQIGYEAGYSEGFDASVKPADGYITIPRETFDQMQRALEVLSNLDADINFLNTNELEEMVDSALSAAKAVQPQAKGEDKLRETVATVLEGWTIPDAVRKMLETAYWSHPQASEPTLTENERIKAFLNKHKTSAFPKGACPTCDGEGEIGGQFCGGYQVCPDCSGSGKPAAPEATK